MKINIFLKFAFTVYDQEMNVSYLFMNRDKFPLDKNERQICFSWSRIAKKKYMEKISHMRYTMFVIIQ